MGRQHEGQHSMVCHRLLQSLPHGMGLGVRLELDDCRFYFSVENATAGIPYIFRVSNLTKPDSLYNQGMRPLCFSMEGYDREKGACKPGGGWMR